MNLFSEQLSREGLQDKTREAMARQHANTIEAAINTAAYYGKDYCKVDALTPVEMQQLEDAGLDVEYIAGKYIISWTE